MLALCPQHVGELAVDVEPGGTLDERVRERDCVVRRLEVTGRAPDAAQLEQARPFGRRRSLVQVTLEVVTDLLDTLLAADAAEEADAS